MATLMKAHHQWATRPDDERYTSLDTMLSDMLHKYDLSHMGVSNNRTIAAAPVDTGSEGIDRKGLAILVNDQPTTPSHWAFGQLCSLVGAPAGYLRTLPSDLVADCVNQSMLSRKIESVGWLIENGEDHVSRALTGPQYGRIWNKDIVRQLIDRFGNGIDGKFRVPGEFGRRVPVTKDNTTLYAGDRDMFVFLADEENRIDVPGRRDGMMGSLARGFYVQNSEVGAATLKIGTFLFDYVCSNRIIWGAEDVQEISIRHSARAPDRWLSEIAPAIQNYAEKSTASITSAIEDARSRRIDEDQLTQFLEKRFTKAQAVGIKLAHDADEGRPIETMWDAVVGATAYARNIKHQDDRVAIERVAGKILTSASH